MENTFCFIIGLFMIFFTTTTFCDNKNSNTRLKDAIQSNNRSNVTYGNENNSSQNEEDENILKKEARKMLKECGVDINESDEENENAYLSTNRNKNYNSFNSNFNRRYNYKNKFNLNDNNDDSSSSSSEFSSSGYGGNRYNGNNYNPYGNRNDWTNNNNGYNSGYGNNNNKNNRNGASYGQNNDRYNNDRGSYYGSYHNYEPNLDYGYSSTPTYGTNRVTNCRNPSGSNFPGGYGFNRHNNYPHNRGTFEGFSSAFTQLKNYRGSSSNSDRNYNSNSYNKNNNNNSNNNNGQYGNSNRNGGNNDDNQCVSQCVFSYLHILDEERTPSESLLLKWIQEHYQGDDMKRIKRMRDARKCFARLTTSDIDDGCEFSEQLAKCLDLDLE